jgi:hypothetical protein
MDGVMLRIAGTFCALLIAYMVFWGFWYRVPGDAAVIDLRTAGARDFKCVTFCGSLASNAHGFPGHAYVAWSDAPPADFATVEATGYVPFRACDQIPSLVSNVRGCVVTRASEGNLRNLDTLSVLVDADKFERARRTAAQWRSELFRVGVRDCVRYTDAIARDLGLKTPRADYKFPQDYIRELKALNRIDSELDRFNTRGLVCR